MGYHYNYYYYHSSIPYEPKVGKGLLHRSPSPEYSPSHADPSQVAQKKRRRLRRIQDPLRRDKP